MGTTSTIAGLNLFTLGAVLLIMIGVLVYFFRKRRNRVPLQVEAEEKHAARTGRPAPTGND